MKLDSCHLSGPHRQVPCVVISGNKVRLTAVTYGGNTIITLRCPVRACVRACVCVLWTAHDFDLQYDTVVLVTYFIVPTCLDTLGNFKRFHEFVQL
jgi:hypothetical protein